MKIFKFFKFIGDFFMIILFPPLFFVNVKNFIDYNIIYTMLNVRSGLFHFISFLILLAILGISAIYFELTDRSWERIIYVGVSSIVIYIFLIILSHQQILF